MWSLPDVSFLVFPRNILQRCGNMRLKWVWVFPGTCPESDIQEASKCQGRPGTRRYTLKVFPFLLMGCHTPGRSEGKGVYLGLIRRRSGSLCGPAMGSTPASCNLDLTPPNCLRNADCWSSAVPDGAIAFVSFWNISSISQSISCLWLLRTGTFPRAFGGSEENERKIEDSLKLAKILLWMLGRDTSSWNPICPHQDLKLIE